MESVRKDASALARLKHYAAMNVGHATSLVSRGVTINVCLHVGFGAVGHQPD